MTIPLLADAPQVLGGCPVPEYDEMKTGSFPLPADAPPKTVNETKN